MLVMSRQLHGCDAHCEVFPQPADSDLLPLLQVGDCNKGGELTESGHNFVQRLAAQMRRHLCGFVVSMHDAMGRMGPAAAAGCPKHAASRRQALSSPSGLLWPTPA